MSDDDFEYDGINLLSIPQPCGGYYCSEESGHIDCEDGLVKSMLEAPCDCGHGRDFHTFASDGESLCDLCECADYGRAERDIVALQSHERFNR